MSRADCDCIAARERPPDLQPVAERCLAQTQQVAAPASNNSRTESARTRTERIEAHFVTVKEADSRSNTCCAHAARNSQPAQPETAHLRRPDDQRHPLDVPRRPHLTYRHWLNTARRHLLDPNASVLMVKVACVAYTHVYPPSLCRSPEGSRRARAPARRQRTRSPPARPTCTWAPRPPRCASCA